MKPMKLKSRSAYSEIFKEGKLTKDEEKELKLQFYDVLKIMGVEFFFHDSRFFSLSSIFNKTFQKIGVD